MKLRNRREIDLKPKKVSVFRSLIACLAVLALAGLAAGCQKNQFTKAPDSIPPEYYGAIATSPDDLITAYYGRFGNAGNPVLADTNYGGKPVVFKSIVVDERMLLGQPQGYMDISTIHCIAMDDGELAKVKPGDLIDIVGVNNGMIAGRANWLLMDRCLFLPAGFAAVPVSGGTVFSGGY
jgi:hypothetical protein